MQAQRLAGALGQGLAVAGERREAADVHVPQVVGRLAADHPFGDQPPGPAAVGDAGAVEAGADEVAAQLGRLAQDEVAFGREALRAVEQHLHRRRLQAGRAVHRVLHQRLELLPVLVQQLELERVRDGLHPPGFGHRLETAHQQATDLFLVVDEAVGVAHHRQHRVHALDAVGDDVEMLGRVQRHVHAGQRTELPRPLAGAVDQRLAAHLALRGAHTGDPAAFDDHAGDLDILHQLGAAVACALGQRHRQVGRVRLAVARDPDRAVQVVGAHHRIQVAGFLGRDQLHLDAEAARQRGLLVQHHPALGRGRHVDAAALLPAGGETRLGFERGIQLDAVLAHARHVAVGPHLPHQPGGMPGSAAGEPTLLQQQHVAAAELGQVVGGRTAGDAAADDQGLDMGRQVHGARLPQPTTGPNTAGAPRRARR